MKREFLMLGKPIEPKWSISNHWMSVKYDGQRCLWDGGATRGMLKRHVPWANTAKDARYVSEQVATGLWTRYGNVIHAPDWFLDTFPENVMLDGELWLGNGRFQELRSIISKLTPIDTEWKIVKYFAFDMPMPHIFAESGTINNPQFKKKIVYHECMDVLKNVTRFEMRSFAYVYDQLAAYRSSYVQRAWQVQLPKDVSSAWEMVLANRDVVIKDGGEGLIIRANADIWYPMRTPTVLKVKDIDTSEGIVTGYVWGEGKLYGLMGAAIVMHNGKEFRLSGFTDAERRMSMNTPCEPGTLVSDDVFNSQFPRMGSIRFQHMGYTNDGLPREPRYAR